MFKKLGEITFNSNLPDDEKIRNCTHDFETVKYDTPANIHITQCNKCGVESLIWDWKPLENTK